MATDLPKLVRINDAAAALAVCRSQIYKLVKQGKLVRVEIGLPGHGSRITEESIRAFVAARTVASTVATGVSGSQESPESLIRQGPTKT